MDDARSMRGVECGGDVDSDGERLIDRQCTLPQSFRQRLPVDVLDDEIVDAVVVTNVVQRADVRMIQFRDRAGLAAESRTAIGIVHVLIAQYLDRDNAIEPRVTHVVDLTHAAAPERRQNFVRTEPLTYAKRHRLRPS